MPHPKGLNLLDGANCFRKQTMREESDYNCVYEVQPDELKERIEPARRLIETISRIVNS